MTHAAVIIGCGMIAGGYDELQINDPGAVLTHAKALTKSPDFEITACVEPDDARRKAFMSHWAIPKGYPDLDTCLNALPPPDVVCVCTPKETHGDILGAMLGSGVKAVFCEKPIITELADARQIVAAYEARDILLAVNYIRRWNDSIISLRDEISSGTFGPLLSFNAQYTGGLLNNGSHMLDLLIFLFGKIEPFSLFRRNGCGDHDYSCDVLMRIPPHNAVGSMIACDEATYGLFELNLCFENRSVSLTDWGREMQIRQPDADPLTVGRLILGSAEKTETNWREAQANAIENIHLAMTTGAALNSDGISALASLEICDAMIKMPVSGGDIT